MTDANDSSQLQTGALLWCGGIPGGSLLRCSFHCLQTDSTRCLCACLYLHTNFKSKHKPTCWKLAAASGVPGSGTDLGLVTLGLITNAEPLSSAHID